MYSNVIVGITISRGLSRLPKQSRKRSYPLSSISLVVKIVNFVFLNGGKGVVNVAEPKWYRLLANCKGSFLHVLRRNFCENNRERLPHSCTMQLFVVFTVVLKAVDVRQRFSKSMMSSVGNASLTVDCCITVSVHCNANTVVVRYLFCLNSVNKVLRRLQFPSSRICQ